MELSSRPSRRGPYARSQQRREQIAAAVLKIVDESGHEAVTTALVARRSSTAESTVLYHYPSRDHLLVAALTLADEQALEASGGNDNDAWLDLQDLGQTVTGSRQEGANRTRLLVVLQSQVATEDHPATEYFAQRVSRSVEIFTDLIRRRQEAGLAHPGLDARQVAQQIIALWNGLTVMWTQDPTLDIEPLLYDAARRLTGENWMRARAMLAAPEIGL